MVAFRLRMSLSPARRSRVIGSLRRTLGFTRALPGCTECQLCASVEDENQVFLLVEWSDLQSLRSYLRGDSFRVVLSALDCASEPPAVRFDTIAKTAGMELITACRAEGGRPDY